MPAVGAPHPDRELRVLVAEGREHRRHAGAVAPVERVDGEPADDRLHRELPMRATAALANVIRPSRSSTRMASPAESSTSRTRASLREAASSASRSGVTSASDTMISSGRPSGASLPGEAFSETHVTPAVRGGSPGHVRTGSPVRSTVEPGEADGGMGVPSEARYDQGRRRRQPDHVALADPEDPLRARVHPHDPAGAIEADDPVLEDRKDTAAVDRARLDQLALRGERPTNVAPARREDHRAQSNT